MDWRSYDFDTKDVYENFMQAFKLNCTEPSYHQEHVKNKKKSVLYRICSSFSFLYIYYIRIMSVYEGGDPFHSCEPQEGIFVRDCSLPDLKFSLGFFHS